MKDAVGGASLLNLVVIFVSIIILLFVGILSFSKAYKVKNRIIEVIEKYETYDTNVAKELKEDLRRAGYSTASNNQILNRCGENSLSSNLEEGAGYYYCVYPKCYSNKDASGNCTGEKSYEVVSYVRFEFPVIGNVMSVPVKGETKILNKIYDY